ncbi:hemerythrin HHE cation binding domain-containing protein [Venturia nashicola]|uniref:Hemerythrin HHE cation binding domain-containing protein n=1 Tax=Venturia nashicola TaxID=86259 RepID=A0A4Z1NU67_9PEZI|nr:hemerythrin HHE cation binding domain-containing protein [Venturia nashicola]
MVTVHNPLIRGLNAIVLQAEQVPAQEEYFFGALDNKYGQGTMQQSFDEHAAFHSGLEKLAACLQSCAAEEEEFNGPKLVDIINTFSEPLIHHMSSEIVTILALTRFPEAEVYAIFESTLTEALKKLHAASLVT